MDMFNVLKYAMLDVERTEADKAIALKAAQSAKEQAIGAVIAANMDNPDLEAAGAAGVEAYQKEAANFRLWYTLDPDVIYPAALDWLVENQILLGAYANRSDADLVGLALGGDQLAHFVLKARQTVVEIVICPLSMWQLAGIPRTEFAEGEDNPELTFRASVLETTRRFFTEALHQAAGVPIGIKILAGDKRWAL